MLVSLEPHLARIDALHSELTSHFGRLEGEEPLRADLAGMFVVTCVAMYETCVKETLIQYASRRNTQFEHFVTKKFDRLNSRINLPDLHLYSAQFDDRAVTGFKKGLSRRRVRLGRLAKADMDHQYANLLKWRHSFAHAARRETTLEEAYRAHRISRHVILAFGEAFNNCE